MPEHRSGCPINLATEVLGDKWSLVVLRDLMFGDRRYFRELLHGSKRGSRRTSSPTGCNGSSPTGWCRARPTRRTSRRSATASPSRPSSLCRSWPTSARGDAGIYRSAASSPSALSFSKPAAPNCGTGLWTSYASATSASSGRPARNPCSPTSKPPTRPKSPSDPTDNAPRTLTASALLTRAERLAIAERGGHRLCASFSAACGTQRAALPKTIAVAPTPRSDHPFQLR